jgi:hypothetical protein
MQRIDLTGQKFGELTVISYSGDGKWNCKCSCGNITQVKTTNLKYGKSKSCGCKRKNIFRDLTGQRFGQLVAIEYIKSSKRSKWLCVCDCGKETNVITDNLTRGHTTSCGCIRPKALLKAVTKHEMCHTKVYHAWNAMRSRCINENNSKYPIYGGRGIKVCDRWVDSFENFYEDMGEPPTPKHSIDRIDVNGNYEPSNCKWSTQKEQCNNQRRCRKIEYNNETHTIKEWAELKGISYSKLIQRIDKLNWTFEKAISTK